MKHLLLATALAIMPLAGAEAGWYTGHFGAETCVRIENIGDNFEHVYYGIGSMRVPEDFAAQAKRLGVARMTRVYDNATPGVVRYRATFARNKQLDYLFFDNRETCQRFMDSIEP